MTPDDGSPVNLAKVIEQAIALATDRLEGRELATVAEYPAHLPAVSGEFSQLARITSCLLQQALSWSDTDELQIKASLVGQEVDELPGVRSEVAEDFESGGPWVLLSVGFIVSASKKGTIRDSLLRGSSNEVDWHSDDCRDLLLEISHHLWLTEIDEDGRRFDLLLPIWGAYEIDTASSSLRQAVETRLGSGGSSDTTLLLLVEDDEMRQHLAADLESSGYRVIKVANGEEVLPLARAEEPSLILLDLVARAPTAFEVAGILKHDRRTRNLPVLFLTSVDDPSGEISMGTVGFLPRQPDTGAIISAINAVLTSGLTPLSRVLVVENDVRLRDHMVMTIQGQGYRVSEAGTPEEAMALAERARPDVALINAGLAQERDYWLLRGLRNAAREAEIYVMADVMDEEEARLAMRRGASGYSETGQLPDLLERMRRRPEDEG